MVGQQRGKLLIKLNEFGAPPKWSFRFIRPCSVPFRCGGNGTTTTTVFQVREAAEGPLSYLVIPCHRWRALVRPILPPELSSFT